MKHKQILVTGSAGIIGSEVCTFFQHQGYVVHGLDNNQRAVFLGPLGDTRWNLARLQRELSGYVHHELDIRNRQGVLELVKDVRPSVIVHTTAQPSHDRAAAIPFDDFDTNAVGTLNLLEAAHQFCPESPFIHMSSNKVYGDLPNTIRLRELPSRWDYDDPAYAHGIPETFSIDQSKHSLFGASKVAGDVLVQEYTRAQAIEDGVLVDVSETATHRGFPSLPRLLGLRPKPRNPEPNLSVCRQRFRRPIHGLSDRASDCGFCAPHVLDKAFSHPMQPMANTVNTQTVFSNLAIRCSSF